MLDFENLKKDFAIFNSFQLDGKGINKGKNSLHYLDSAASSQKPSCVIDAIVECYQKKYGPVHRGFYSLAEVASEQYEASRQTIADYVNAEDSRNVVFTRSTTEAINIVASGWAKKHVHAGDEIWVSQMEHHSNFLPWQRVCQENGADLKVIPLDLNGRLDLSDVTGIFGSKTKLIAITHISNVLGICNPVEEITALANAHSIPVLVDAAQSLGHMNVDVQKLGCDFLVGSAHKMCGPTGIGFLYAKSSRLMETEPLLLGGGMVDEASVDGSSWADIPERFEGGSPNLSGAVGFAAAARYLDNIGREVIEIRVCELTKFARTVLEKIVGVTVYGINSDDGRSGIVSFNIEGVHPHDVAQIANERGVAIRAGHHCCQPLMDHLGVSSTVRASFSFYNNEADILALEQAIVAAQKIFLI